ncbi:aminotransferase [Longispora fulva]|uniref:Aminotransferase n=1 Tax=Longispora fulva TaxID=619741 RepID=A0A8J7KZC1_9ACTN|nr:Rv2231c family pyridoxal phosphate-dependent protein CobC [Longispora fulva]MBG6140717.1 histidinol-phosphate aminotransferase [Longispora fulva]GIG61019.1 aminotransferase [Longispora fulva]
MDPLRHHGDTELRPGLVDLAVNVRTAPHPEWLSGPLLSSMSELAAYPDQTRARAAIAARHGRDPREVLLTAGAAQAFTLLAQVLRPRRAVVVHPQFTEPEAALAAHGHVVERVVLRPPFILDPALVPGDADLVIIGNPTNPTSVLHPRGVLRALARPGRVLVVDEAFADTVPGEPESLAGDRNPAADPHGPDPAAGRIPGLVVIRSLTKTWGLAGLRIGYLLADPALVRAMTEVQPLWPVSTPALVAAEVCAEAAAAEERIAHEIAADRAYLVARLAELPGIEVVGTPTSSFVLVRTPGALELRERLIARGFVVRRGDTFPGLGPDWLRISVRDTAVTDAFVDVLKNEVH